MAKKTVNVPNEKAQSDTKYSDEAIKKYEDHLIEEATDTEPVKPYPTWAKVIVILMVAIILIGLLAGALIAFT